MVIHIYGPGPSCQKCNATKRWLKKMGLRFEDKDTNDPLNAAFAKDLGHSTSPVVVVFDEDGVIAQHWSDHRVSLLERLVA